MTTTLTDALFAEYADGVYRALVPALAKAFVCVGGRMPRFLLWERVADLRVVLDSGRAFFEPAEFLARFRGTKTDMFDFTAQPGVLDCFESLVRLALLADPAGPEAVALLAQLKARHLPAALADAEREDD